METINPNDIKLETLPLQQRLFILLKTWKIPLAVAGVILIGGSVIVFLLFSKHHISNSSSPSNPYANDPSVVSSHPILNPKTATRSADYPFVYNSKAANVAPSNRSNSSSKPDTLQPSPYNLPEQYITPYPNSAQQAPPSSNNSTKGNANTNQSSNSGSSGSSNQLTSDPSQAPDASVPIYFQDPGTGTITQYVPPTEAPYAIVWLRYVNQQDHYAIDYPAGWSLIKTVNNGHEGLNLFPPGEDTNDLSAFRIGVGWNTQYLLPTGGSAQAALRQPLYISNQTGTLYTQGAIGESYIAAVLTDAGGQFGIISNASTDLLTYVFQHMLSSIQIIY